MQVGVAAHDLIEHEDQYLVAHGEPRAAMVSRPRPHLAARPRAPEYHGPGLTEQELGEALHSDRNAAHGHPGVNCDELPAGHAHRLPQYREAGELQNPLEAEAPLLVDPFAGTEAPGAGGGEEQQ